MLRLPSLHSRGFLTTAVTLLGGLVVALLLFGPASQALALETESPHGDPNPQSSRCRSCHNTHATGDATIDSRAPQSTCVSCHEVDLSDAEGGNSLAKHGASIGCSACHSPHKSGPAWPYVDPDNRSMPITSPLDRVTDDQGAVYVLVGSAHDGLAPVISGVALSASTGGTSPTVSWTTSEAATSWVDWGTTTSYEGGNEYGGTPFGTGDLLQSHRVQMQGLTPGVTYHYRVRSADALGNVSVSEDRTFVAYDPPVEELAAEPDATTTPVPSAIGTPVFADEFDGPLDGSVWEQVTPSGTRYTPSELQYYDPENVSFSNGAMRILTERRYVAGYAYASGIAASLKRSFSYGYFESRFRIPPGKGLLPAFWLTDGGTHEIDVMQLLGEDPSRMYFTYDKGGSQLFQGYFDDGTDLTAGWHTVGVDWQPTYIRWYLDGQLASEYTDDITSEPMHMIFNTAVGGTWAVDPDSSTQFPQTFEIDYVRVYDQKPAGGAEALAELQNDMEWRETHAPYESETGYSVDTDRIALIADTGSARNALAPVAGWESAGVETAKPMPTAPGTPLDSSTLARASADDGQYISTHETIVDREWNWQVMKFDVSQLGDLRSLNLVWNGHGEPTIGYPTALYVWEDGAWQSISTAQMGTDTDVSADRSTVAAELCLACHDEAAPLGVTMPEGTTDIRSAWQGDLHGAGVGDGFGGTPVQSPYARGSEAIDCSTCHDSHGTSNIYHVPTTVNGSPGISATSGSQLRSLCSSCHQGTLDNWHAPCVDCHTNGHWAGWVDPPVESRLPNTSSDCTSCHGHGKSWTHPATCVRCHGETELKALGATPDAPWTYERTF